MVVNGIETSWPKPTVTRGEAQRLLIQHIHRENLRSLVNILLINFPILITRVKVYYFLKN